MLICINLTAIGATLPTQTELNIKILPKHGQTTRFILTTPDAYLGRIVDIY
jgi:hypothetical protein